MCPGVDLGIAPLRKGPEEGCSGPEDSPQLLRLTGRINPRCSGTSPLPRTHTHRSAGDPSNPLVWPAAPPATWPAALLPAAWLDSSASRHPGTKAEKLASRRLRLGNCNQSSLHLPMIHRPRTGRSPGGLRVVGCPSTSWDVTAGKAAPWAGPPPTSSAPGSRNC